MAMITSSPVRFKDAALILRGGVACNYSLF